MDINKSISELITFSLKDWIKDKTLKKYFIILAIIYVIYSAISSVLLYNLFSNFTQFEDPAIIIPQIISVFGAMGILIIPLMLVLTYFKYQIIYSGLNLVKLKGKKISITNYITMLILPIIIQIAALLSIYELKKLLIGITGFLILIIGIAVAFVNPGLGALLILIGTLTCFAYLVIVIINSIRLSLSEVTYLMTGNISKSLKESFTITKNEVLNIFILFFIFSIILMIIVYIVSIPMMIYSFVNSIGSAISGQQEINILVDPIYFILSIVVYVVSAYIIIAQNLFIVAIYKKLKK